jgi:rhodanese-related sulfurtransferase
MRLIIVCCLLIASHVFTSAQYKYDNVKFKTVYLEDLCKTLQNNPGFTLLDVRSIGEHNDTSQSLEYNMGYLKNSMHIDVRELPKRLNELQAYRDKPLFIYCSHSQRSRRASKMLSDSGFTKVFNVNGGMTSLHLFENDLAACPDLTVQSNLSYKLISPQLLYATNAKSNYYIVDIRSESAFNGTTGEQWRKALGRIKGAVNMPQAKMSDEYKVVPKNRRILIVDEDGHESPQVAKQLMDKGYKDVSVLFNGMDAMMQYRPGDNVDAGLVWIPATKYHLLTGEEFDALLRNNKNVAILDVRTKDEFNNTAGESWRNIGRVKTAINIPVDELKNAADDLKIPKEQQVVVYAFTSGQSFDAANILTERGYKNVSVLLGGLFNLRWKAANIKGKSALKDWAENIPVEN